MSNIPSHWHVDAAHRALVEAARKGRAWRTVALVALIALFVTLVLLARHAALDAAAAWDPRPR